MSAEITKEGTKGLKGMSSLSAESYMQPNLELERYAEDLSELTKRRGYVKTAKSFEPKPYINVSKIRRETDYGESKYDGNIIQRDLDTDSPYDNNRVLNNERAIAQSGIDRIANGVTKMTIQAGTAFVDSFASLLSLIPMGYTLTTKGDISGIWDNPMTRFFENIRDWGEETFKSYETTGDANKEWYSKLGSSKFWGDSVLANLGFTIGTAAAMYASGGLAAATKATSLASKTAKVLYAAGNATKSAVKATKGISKGIKGIKEAYNASKNAADLGKSASKLRILQEAAQKSGLASDRAKVVDQYKKLRELVAQKSELTNFINGTAAATFGAVGEARLEALNASDEFIEGEKAKYKALYDERREKLEEDRNFGILSEKDYLSKLQQLNAEEQETYNYINEQALKVGNLTFSLNMPLLTLSNGIQFGKFITGSYKNAYRMKNVLLKGSGLKSEAKHKFWHGNKYFNAARAGIKSGITEGFEEGSQQYITDTAKNWKDADTGIFYRTRRDPSATRNLISTISSIGSAAADMASKTWTDPSTWEQVVVGAITGMFGLPAFGRVKDERTGKTKTKFTGWSGAFGEIKDSLREYKEAQEHIDFINGRIRDNKNFKNSFTHLVASESAGAELDKATTEGDAFKYKNTEHRSMIEDIIKFDNIGALDLYLELANDALNVDKMSDEEVLQLVKEAESSVVNESGEVTSASPETLDEKGNNKNIDEIRADLNKKLAKIQNAVIDYATSKQRIKALTGDRIKDDEDLQELIWMDTQIEDWKRRAPEMLKNEKFKSVLEIMKNAYKEALSEKKLVTYTEIGEDGKEYEITDARSLEELSEMFDFTKDDSFESYPEAYKNDRGARKLIKQRKDLIKQAVEAKKSISNMLNLIEELDVNFSGTAESVERKVNRALNIIAGFSMGEKDVEANPMKEIINFLYKAFNTETISTKDKEAIDSAFVTLRDLGRIGRSMQEFQMKINKYSDNPKAMKEDHEKEDNKIKQEVEELESEDIEDIEEIEDIEDIEDEETDEYITDKKIEELGLDLISQIILRIRKNVLNNRYAPLNDIFYEVVKVLFTHPVNKGLLRYIKEEGSDEAGCKKFAELVKSTLNAIIHKQKINKNGLDEDVDSERLDDAKDGLKFLVKNIESILKVYVVYIKNTNSINKDDLGKIRQQFLLAVTDFINKGENGFISYINKYKEEINKKYEQLSSFLSKFQEKLPLKDKKEKEGKQGYEDDINVNNTTISEKLFNELVNKIGKILNNSRIKNKLWKIKKDLYKDATAGVKNLIKLITKAHYIVDYVLSDAQLQAEISETEGVNVGTLKDSLLSRIFDYIKDKKDITVGDVWDAITGFFEELGLRDIVIKLRENDYRVDTRATPNIDFESLDENEGNEEPYISKIIKDAKTNLFNGVRLYACRYFTLLHDYVKKNRLLNGKSITDEEIIDEMAAAINKSPTLSKSFKDTLKKDKRKTLLSYICKNYGSEALIHFYKKLTKEELSDTELNEIVQSTIKSDDVAEPSSSSAEIPAEDIKNTSNVGGPIENSIVPANYINYNTREAALQSNDTLPKGIKSEHIDGYKKFINLVNKLLDRISIGNLKKGDTVTIKLLDNENLVEYNYGEPVFGIFDENGKLIGTLPHVGESETKFYKSLLGIIEKAKQEAAKNPNFSFKVKVSRTIGGNLVFTNSKRIPEGSKAIQNNFTIGVTKGKDIVTSDGVVLYTFGTSSYSGLPFIIFRTNTGFIIPAQIRNFTPKSDSEIEEYISKIYKLVAKNRGNNLKEIRADLLKFLPKSIGISKDFYKLTKEEEIVKYLADKCKKDKSYSFRIPSLYTSNSEFRNIILQYFNTNFVIDSNGNAIHNQSFSLDTSEEFPVDSFTEGSTNSEGKIIEDIDTDEKDDKNDNDKKEPDEDSGTEKNDEEDNENKSTEKEVSPDDTAAPTDEQISNDSVIITHDQGIEDEDGGDDFDSPFRLKNEEYKEKRSKEKIKEDIQEEIKEVERMIPGISKDDAISIVEGLIRVGGKEAWGQFVDGIIKISDTAAPGTVYHEAFHKVFRMYLSYKRKKEVLSELSKLTGITDKTILEEYLAELFRDFVQNEITKRETKGFFARIKNKLNDLLHLCMFWRSTKSIESLFKAIYKGKITEQLSKEQLKKDKEEEEKDNKMNSYATSKVKKAIEIFKLSGALNKLSERSKSVVINGLIRLASEKNLDLIESLFDKISSLQEFKVGRGYELSDMLTSKEIAAAVDVVHTFIDENATVEEALSYFDPYSNSPKSKMLFEIIDKLNGNPYAKNLSDNLVNTVKIYDVSTPEVKLTTSKLAYNDEKFTKEKNDYIEKLNKKIKFETLEKDLKSLLIEKHPFFDKELFDNMSYDEKIEKMWCL